MLQDMGNLPIAGSALVAGLFYAGFAYFVTGPLIGERTIAKSDWPRQCQAELHRDLALSRPPAPAMPDLNCNSLFGNFFGAEGQAWCQAYGGSFQLPMMDVLQSAEAQKREQNDRRIERAAAMTQTRCECAAASVIESARSSFALYAGSLRLVTPPAVNSLSTGLRTALSSPPCAMKG